MKNLVKTVILYKQGPFTRFHSDENIDVDLELISIYFSRNCNLKIALYIAKSRFEKKKKIVPKLENIHGDFNINK